jgi:hypothetical protein
MSRTTVIFIPPRDKPETIPASGNDAQARILSFLQVDKNRAGALLISFHACTNLDAKFVLDDVSNLWASSRL